MAAIGAPLENKQYRTVEVNGIKVYYPANLQVKAGYSCISIKLRKLFCFGWLELEGAKAIAIYN
jgi:hypothetical protein